MKFTKMHGLGNDYIYMTELPEDPAVLSIRVSDRHFGIGSDGLILILPSETADFQMRIFNADGSEAMMCGNGIRCVGKYVYDKGLTRKKLLTIDTLSGIKTLELFTNAQDQVERVSVDMGAATVSRELQINLSAHPSAPSSADSALSSDGSSALSSYGSSLNSPVDSSSGTSSTASKLSVTGTPVSVGNPHFVIFTENAETVPLATIGPMIEHHEAFPCGVNVEFVQILDTNHLRMRVWERGSGITMACGTGACASVAAAVSRGFCYPEVPVQVELDGGTLEIRASYPMVREKCHKTAEEGSTPDCQTSRSDSSMTGKPFPVKQTDVIAAFQIQMIGPAITICDGVIQ